MKSLKLKWKASSKQISESLLFLFFIQQITFLVESIYMLNLLNTRMDSRAFGIFLLTLPVLLIWLKNNKRTDLTLLVVMLASIWMSPLLSTGYRIFSSGVGAGTYLIYLGLQLSKKGNQKINWGQSVAIATVLSIIFRAFGDSLDISISGDGKVLSWSLVFLCFALHIFSSGTSEENSEPDENFNTKSGNWLIVIGLFSCFIFIYFVFSSPGVVARWIEGDFEWIQLVTAGSILLALVFGIYRLDFIRKNLMMIKIWNVIFIFLFILNIILHQITFPTFDNLTPVIVGPSIGFSMVVCYFMLALSPIILVNIELFSMSIKPVHPSRLAISFLIAVLFLILSVFILIFTNTWGYVGSISRFFRNQFHLPFLISGISMILPYLFKKFNIIRRTIGFGWRFRMLTFVVLILLLFASIFMNSHTTTEFHKNGDQLKLMTFNIQQGVDLFGNKNYEGQLKKIEEIDPDILCLQESDVSRISGGNSDVVRYFSENLGYYKYYGPKTVTGTYGTAILSKFPLKDCKSIFTYSSKDEIGTAIAKISLENHSIKIINSHPAGDAKSREEHIEMVIDEANESDNVIAMGDYNFKQDSPYYQKITSILYDSWLSIYPDAIGSIDTVDLDLTFVGRKPSSGKLLDGGKINMSSRIDHIFLSESFEVTDANYLPAPESETDHPLYWVLVQLINHEFQKDNK